MTKVKCDFCGCEFEWTAEQIHLDIQLRLMGSGLGAMCSPCDDKQIEIFLEEERLDEESRQWEDTIDVG